MKITRETDYAMRIMLLLTCRKEHVEAKRIAEECDIPYRFALKILRKLVQAGLAKSYRGMNGGYTISEKKEITLLDVVEAIDGIMAINTCMENPDSCKESARCKIRRSLAEAQTVFADKLRSVSFLDLMEEEEKD